MGNRASRNVQPEELVVFKNLPYNYNLDNIEIPERAENRKPTDRNFLIAFGVVLIALFPFLIYTLVHADTDRFSGYDYCGNVCGKKNFKYNNLQCSGKDTSNQGFLQVDDVNDTKVDLLLSPRTCVSECSADYEQVAGYCFKRNRAADYDNDLKWNTVWKYLRDMAWRVTLACFLSLGIAMVLLYALRAATKVMVWSILTTVIVFLAGATGAFWYLNSQDNWSYRSGTSPFLGLAVFFSVFLIATVVLIFFMRHKIALIVALLKEAMKATFAMPRLMLVVVVVFLVEFIILAAFATTSIFMFSSGILTETEYYREYKTTPVMYFSMVFNLWMTIWVLEFIIELQYMIIAGAVVKWYFSKTKNALNNPVLTSAAITFKFHLGSIAFGSMVITLVGMIRAILTSLTNNHTVKIIIDSCCSIIQDLLKFLTKNAYIMMAMHGQPFYKSGKRAGQIILQNVVNIAAINSIGNFVLGMAQLLVVLMSLACTYLIMLGTESSEYEWSVYVIVGVVSLVVAIICFSVFGCVIDTIFICFCEDSLLNDGMTRPFAMSRELMEFVEVSKKFFIKKKK